MTQEASWAQSPQGRASSFQKLQWLEQNVRLRQSAGITLWPEMSVYSFPEETVGWRRCPASHTAGGRQPGYEVALRDHREALSIPKSSLSHLRWLGWLLPR